MASHQAVWAVMYMYVSLYPDWRFWDETENILQLQIFFIYVHVYSDSHWTNEAEDTFHL